MRWLYAWERRVRARLLRGRVKDAMPPSSEVQLEAVDDAVLIPLVREALGSPTVALRDWQCLPIRGGASRESRVYRFVGEGDDRGEPVRWSLILKVAYPLDDDADPYAGRREPLAYRSGILDDLPGGLVAPRCFGVSEQPGAEFWIWLEEVIEDHPGTWPLARYGLAARHLGQFNGLYLTDKSVPDWPWLHVRRLDVWIQRVAPVITRFPELAMHPLLQKAYSPAFVRRILRLWGDRGRLLQALERLPQTLCHGDAFRRNLLARERAGQAQTVAIDWAWMGIGPVGEDIAPLVAVSLAFFEVEASAASEFDQVVFQEYVAGLSDVGWQGDPALVRLGYTIATGLRYGLGTIALLLAIVLDQRRQQQAAQAIGRPIEEVVEGFAVMTRFALDRADEALALLEGRS